MPIEIGTYWDHDLANLARFEKNIGMKVDLGRAANWTKDWADFEGAGQAARVVGYGRRPQVMMVPFPMNGNWRAAAAGDYDTHVEQFAKNLVAVSPGTYTLWVGGPGYEVNCDWWYCSVGEGNEGHFRDFSQRIADIFARVSPRLVLCLAMCLDHRFTGRFTDPRKLFKKGAHRAIFLNCYFKPFYNGGAYNNLDLARKNPEAAQKENWRYWRNGPAGLDAMVALAGEHGLPWGIPELGLCGRPWRAEAQGKFSFQPGEALPLHWFCDTLGDYLIANGCDVVLHWFDQKTGAGDYTGDVWMGDTPETAKAVTALYQRLRAASDVTAPGPAPTLPPAPAPTLPPVVVQPPLVAPPANPLLDLLGRINGEASAARGKFPEPTNGKLRQAEHLSWAALAATGRKNGPVGANEETDPTEAAVAIYGLLANHQPLDASASAMIDGWLQAIETQVDEQLPDRETPDRVVVPPPGEVEALKAQVVDLTKQLKAMQAKVAAVRTAIAD